MKPWWLSRRLSSSLVFLCLLTMPSPAHAGCEPGPNTLCLNDGFSVEVDWQDPSMNTGQGQVLPIGGTDWGLFVFEDPRYLELSVRVLNGCAFNQHYWVLALGLSEYEQTLSVTDFVGSSGTLTYDNPAGEFLQVIDTEAIPCPATQNLASGFADDGTNHGPVAFLVDGRFQIELTWEDFEGQTGAGQPVTVTDHSAYFWLFVPDIQEVFLKIVDGSADNGFFQVFWGGTTSVQLDLRITDTCDGTVRTYSNPLGKPAAPIADRTAFAADACTSIFSDGFESGDITLW